MPEERRADPEDGEAYTYDELAEFYKHKYKKKVIEAYWETCTPVKGKGKAKAKSNGSSAAEPKPKAKAKAKEKQRQDDESEDSNDDKVKPEAKSKAKAKAKVKAKEENGETELGDHPQPGPGKRNITIGYHKIRGLGAPLRMMCFYESQSFTNVAYGDDMKEAWFGKTKPELVKKHSGINLPYIINSGSNGGCAMTHGDGELVVTQSNTCLLYLGRVLRIDKTIHFVHNHFVIDQVMDWRNDLMKVVYPFGDAKTKDQFPAVAAKHLEGSTKTNTTKLEGACKGLYMCGESPQSGDFHLFEMLDQHHILATKLQLPDPLEGCPKLKALHGAFKADLKLEKYFEADCYKRWSQNNGLFTHFTGQGDDFKYGRTVTQLLP